MKIERLFYTLLFAGCLLSCNNNRSSTKQVFHYNQSDNIATLDPAFAKNQSIIWAVHQLYNTLVETNSDLEIIPSLAKHWDISEDRLTYTFYLRNDVFFHDNEIFPGGKGRKMVAADVEYSFHRII
ncbi:MAG: ABC transporter substrate-binding protein, partial [Chitinophagaceae bacterium]|nr:ABC transporter substrate-binding protein [Chitinophagaceae bacterium]